MQNQGDRRGNKLVLIFLVVLFIYLAFFGFDAKEAYLYTVNQLATFWQ
jgi:hypothetical protein